MRAKNNEVNLEGLQPCVTRALAAMDVARKNALERTKQQEGTVTSARDGSHKVGSLHYVGLAVDLRINDFVWEFYFALKRELGDGWDVVIEGDHLHVERDPRKLALRPEETDARTHEAVA